MVVTGNPDYARTIRMLRDWGAERKYQHVLKGFNYRLEGIQGAVLRVKLRHLEAWTAARRAAAARYDTLFAGTAVATPHAMPYSRHVYHLYVIRTAHRNAWHDALTAQGIQTGIHYPTPVHLLPAFADLHHARGDFPHSERAADEVLSLPIFPELSEIHSRQIAEAVLNLVPTRAHETDITSTP
jgi:dTDP-4-amino-4,6-dideoxygalactose transaminase